MPLARLHRAALVTALALSAAPAAATPPRVVADMPVTHSLVAMVMDGVGTPDLLLDRGADPHSFQLRPSQARLLAGADLAVWMSADLTPWMARALDSLAGGTALELLAVEGLTLRNYDDDDHGDDHAGDHDDHGRNDHDDEHAHDDHDDEHGRDDHAQDEHGHIEHGHDDDHGHAHDDTNHDAHDQAEAPHDDHGHAHRHGAIDPHAWLDPDNALVWLNAIAERLAALDPEHAPTYRANAERAGAALRSLSDEVESLLTPARGTGIVTYHDAYGYLGDRYGLTLLGSVSAGDAAAPGAARIGALRAELSAQDTTCIFPEANHPDALVTLVVEGSALRLGRPLDPEGTFLEPGTGLYATLLRDLAGAIADCATGN